MLTHRFLGSTSRLRLLSALVSARADGLSAPTACPHDVPALFRELSVLPPAAQTAPKCVRSRAAPAPAAPDPPPPAPMASDNPAPPRVPAATASSPTAPPNSTDPAAPHPLTAP